MFLSGPIARPMVRVPPRPPSPVRSSQQQSSTPTRGRGQRPSSSQPLPKQQHPRQQTPTTGGGWRQPRPITGNGWQQVVPTQGLRSSTLRNGTRGGKKQLTLSNEASTLAGRQKKATTKKLEDLKAEAKRQEAEYRQYLTKESGLKEALEELKADYLAKKKAITSGQPLPEGYQFPNPPTQFGNNLNEITQHNLAFGEITHNRIELSLHAYENEIFAQIKYENGRLKSTYGAISVQALAERIKQRPGYGNVDHVALYACCSASHGTNDSLPIAQRLAYELGKPVVAPVGDIQTTLQGGSFTVTNTGPDAPEFRVFYP